MLRKATLLILWALVLVPALPATAEEGGERRVEALLTLRFDPTSQAVIWPEVRALLLGSPRAAWRGTPPPFLAEPPDTYRAIEVEREEADESGVLCARVRLETREADGALRADQVLDALVDRVRAHVLERSVGERSAMVRASSTLEAAIDARTKEIASGRAEGALPWPLSAAAFYENKLERRAEARRELADLALDAATLRARKEVVAAQRERLLQQEAEAEGEGPDREWEAILHARESLVVEVRGRVEAGTAGPLDLAMAEEELAQARIERAAARRAARAPSPARQDLEAVLLGLEVDFAALEATRRHFRDREERLSTELDAGKADVLRITRLEDEAQVLRERLLDLRERLAARREPRADVIRLD